MSKLTIFTFFVVAIIFVILAELLVSEYLKNQNSVDILEPNTFNQTITEPQILQTSVLTIPEEETSGRGIAPLNNQSSQINFSLIERSGFTNMTLQRVPFEGKLFEYFDLNEVISMPVIEHYLLKNNAARIAIMYEFPLKSGILADEIYLLLKETASDKIGIDVNETNSFGEKSFYINFFENPENAFLVVKKGKGVYAFTYEKEYHNSFIEIIKLLN